MLSDKEYHPIFGKESDYVRFVEIREMDGGAKPWTPDDFDENGFPNLRPNPDYEPALGGAFHFVLARQFRETIPEDYNQRTEEQTRTSQQLDCMIAQNGVCHRTSYTVLRADMQERADNLRYTGIFPDETLKAMKAIDAELAKQARAAHNDADEGVTVFPGATRPHPETDDLSGQFEHFAEKIRVRDGIMQKLANRNAEMRRDEAPASTEQDTSTWGLWKKTFQILRSSFDDGPG